MLNVNIGKGVIADLITPFDDNGKLCLDSVRNLADYARSGGCEGVFVSGAMGGFPYVDVRARLMMAQEIAQFGVPTIVHVSHQNKDSEAGLALVAGKDNASAVALSIDGVTWDEGIESVIRRIEGVVDAAYPVPTLLVIDDGRWISALQLAQICGARLISGVIADTSFEERYTNMKRWTQAFGLEGALFCAGDSLLPVARERWIRRLISPSACVYPEAICKALRCAGGGVRASSDYFWEVARASREAQERAAKWNLPMIHATLYAMNLISSPVPPPPHEPLDKARIERLMGQRSFAL